MPARRAMEESLADVDFPVVGAGSIEGVVDYDVAGDGSIDPSDPGHDGVTVTAVWAGPDGIPDNSDDVTSTTTTVDGAYRFDDLPPGDYEVTVDPATLPDGLVDPTIDPDAAVDLTTDVTLGGTPVADVDFGTTGTASLGDHVFLDEDEDGELDPGEVGVGGVTVTATVTTSSGVLTFTTVTDENGYDQFTDLPAGDYVVTLDPTTIPVGLIPSVMTRSATLVINGADDSLDLALVARPGPTAIDDHRETPMNTPIDILVVDNDIVPSGTSVTVTQVNETPNGSITIEGVTITYVPDPGFFGTDTFTYTICNTDGLAEFGDDAASRLVFCSGRRRSPSTSRRPTRWSPIPRRRRPVTLIRRPHPRPNPRPRRLGPSPAPAAPPHRCRLWPSCSSWPASSSWSPAAAASPQR
ncbi:MAG: SdrD B-like domain-containing protein, partial [Ilumatobacteraceae bacterium]